MISAYCIQNNLPEPQYASRQVLEGFSCEIWINERWFSTWQLCSSFEKAQHAAAHVAIHQILVNPGVNQVPAIDPPVPAASVQGPATSRRKKHQSSGGAGLEVPERKMAEFLSCLSGAPARVTKKSRKRKSREPSTMRPTKNANLHPLVNSRLAPIEEPVEDEVDPLAELKEIQKAVQRLGRNALYNEALASK